MKIIGIGDSTTAGTPGFLSPLEVPPDGSGNRESQYAFWMQKTHPEWTVLNRGISGERSDQVLKRFERDVVREKPDLVILLAGVNDIYQGLGGSFVQENLTAMYDKAEEGKIHVVAATILPYNTASPPEATLVRRINRWIEGTARHRGFVFCDTHRTVADPASYDRLAFTEDGIHPNVVGYRRIGEALTAALEAGLRARSR